MNGLGPKALEGNGVVLVREIALAKRIQRGLENLYRLDLPISIDAFVARADEGEREALLVRETADGLELIVRIPTLDGTDAICQIIEGVSHFVYLADRAARDRGTTQLELELQAEVDKYVVLAASLTDSDRFDPSESRRLRERLYETVRYLHDEGSIEGERYRVANDNARRFTGRLERDFIGPRRYRELRTMLRRFFHMSQSDKLLLCAT